MKTKSYAALEREYRQLRRTFAALLAAHTELQHAWKIAVIGTGPERVAPEIQALTEKLWQQPPAPVVEWEM